MTEEEARALKSDLEQHIGSDERYRHLGSVIYTPGIRELAERADAYWLLDIVASVQMTMPAVRREEFQLWSVKLDGKGGCVVTCKDDEPGNTLYTQEVEYTDFPFEEFSFYCCAEDHLRVLLLKGEY